VSSGFGLEPYDAKTLANFLHRIGALPRPGRGGSNTTFVLPGGTEVRCPNPGGKVTTQVARHVAESTGRTYAELREQVGHPVIAKGKPKRHVAPTAAPQCTKREVLDRLHNLHHLLTEVEAAVRPGVRDSAFYARTLELLGAADQQLQRSVAEVTSKGAFNDG